MSPGQFTKENFSHYLTLYQKDTRPGFVGAAEMTQNPSAFKAWLAAQDMQFAARLPVFEPQLPFPNQGTICASVSPSVEWRQ